MLLEETTLHTHNFGLLVQKYFLIKGKLSALSGPHMDFIQAIHKYSNITVKHFMDEKYQAQTEFRNEKLTV